MINFFDHQNKTIKGVTDLWLNGAKNVLAVLPTGAGKCLGYGTPVLMFDGTVKEVQNVDIGDSLMGIDSTPRIVKSTISGVEQLYRITPVKGAPYIVNESHILSLKQTGTDNIVNITVKDYLSKSNYFKHIYKGWRTKVNWCESKLPELLPPYLLGIWLGDGSTNSASITSADQEIVNYLIQYTTKHGFGLTVKHQPNNKSKFYNITNQRKRLTGLIPVMKELDLFGNKHIPHLYKINSEANRLELLAGILDSDGYLTKGYYDVVFKSEKLIDDVIFLARSLGFAAYKKQCRKTCTNTNVTGTYYRTSICGEVSKIPTKLNRHQPEPRKQKKSVLMTGIKVEPVGLGDYYGFDITGDRLFMLGDFTVTHNTLVKAEVARKELYREFAHLAHANSGITIVFAHRDVLLGQISDAMCMLGLHHTFIAAKHTIKTITNNNLIDHKNSYYDPKSHIIIASVDSYMAKMRKGQINQLATLTTLWMMDESHHLLLDNKWGQCVSTLTNARGLGVTATPLRADNKGLGRGKIIGYSEPEHILDDFGNTIGMTDEQPILDNDGIFDAMFVGASMGELIELGKLSAYRIYAPPSLVDTSGMRITASGDLNQRELAKRTDKNDITGDVIKHYLKIAPHLPAIVYCVNIDHSDHVAEQFNKAGISAKSLSSKTPDGERQKAVKDFKNGLIKVLVNSDLFGEGFDVPALVVGIMLRKTESYSLFKQQFGRPLRKLDGKEYGIIIDHVNNVRDMMYKYGLKTPHDDPEWSLDRPAKPKSGSRGELVGRVCPDCAAFYMPKSTVFECPYCKHEETPAETLEATKTFQHKEGDLVEMSVDFINELMRKRNDVWKSPEQFRHEMSNAPPIVKNSAANNHIKRQYAQSLLAGYIQRWCGDIASVNRWDVKTVHNEFEIEFGVNVLKAQTLSERETLQLVEKIKNEYV